MSNTDVKPGVVARLKYRSPVDLSELINGTTTHESSATVLDVESSFHKSPPEKEWIENQDIPPSDNVE